MTSRTGSESVSSSVGEPNRVISSTSAANVSPAANSAAPDSISSVVASLWLSMAGS